MSTKKKENMIGNQTVTADQRSIAGRRRKDQWTLAVTLELLKQAVALGIPAEYVLFDSCFSSPKMFWQLKQLGLDSVGILKQTKKVYYRYRGRLYDVKGLYERLADAKTRQ